MHIIDQLKARGFVHQITDEAALRSAIDAGPITVYVGADPTAKSLHAGHLLPLLCLRWLTQAGLEPIVIIGGGTAMIGDPTGKDKTRDLLSDSEIAANKAALSAQVRLFAPNARIVDNADWLCGLGYLAFLRDIGAHFSVNRMLSAETFKQRLDREQGLSFIEFNYTLLQSYDFLELYRRHACRLQIGGQDQWFNIVSGCDLIRRVEGAETWGLTIPLLLMSDGRKMGKTAGGAWWLDPEMLSPYHYFQHWLNVADADVEKLLRLYSYLDLDAIAALMADVRVAKRALAVEATAVVHGREAALAADEAAKAVFSGGATEDTPQIVCAAGVTVIAALVQAGFSKSNGEARRLIEGGAVRLGAEVVTDLKAEIREPVVLWAGKKRAVRVTLED
ncbi:MAG: tyrosine--tRNA ligase [Myxococcales bacterium]|nr:tyrosine--tRNA ligase [Myxococcales bacterium]